MRFQHKPKDPDPWTDFSPCLTTSARRVQANVLASSTILAGLILNEREISQILRSEIMGESVIYQQIKQEGREEGIERDLLQSRQSAIAEIALNLLRGGMTVEQVVGFTGLSANRVRELQQNLEGE